MAACRGSRCDLMWLHPPPTSEDSARAYAGYYTHAPPEPPRRNWLATAYRHLKTAHLAKTFGYAPPALHVWPMAFSPLIYLWPSRRHAAEESIRFLHARPGGRLLDVGCGTGAWLKEMQARGWAVEGVDFDAGAVEVARSAGLHVAVGTIHQQNYPSDHFDAVTLNHVIEHVADPVEVLSTCRRILRPGGKLVLFTPNARALGHRWMGRHWRGLEPPRHLQLFGPQAMATAMRQAGFDHVVLNTVNSEFMWKASILAWRRATGKGTVLDSFAAAALVMLAQIWLRADAHSGECLAVEATK